MNPPLEKQSQEYKDGLADGFQLAWKWSDRLLEAAHLEHERQIRELRFQMSALPQCERTTSSE